MRASVVSARRRVTATVERAVAVDRAGKHFVAFDLLDRQRFAGDRRLVHVGASVADDAVERESSRRA